MTKNDREQLAKLAKLFLDAWVNADEPRPPCECGHPREAHDSQGCRAMGHMWSPGSAVGGVLGSPYRAAICDCKGYTPKVAP